MQSPTKTSAFTRLALVSAMACFKTRPIWVWPPRQATPVIRRGQLRRIVEPGEGLEIMVAAVIDELDVEPAYLADGGEHLGLDLAGLVPARLAAGGGIEGEDQPAPRAHGPHGRHGGQLLQEGVDRARRRFLLGQLFTHGTEVVQLGANG